MSENRTYASAKTKAKTSFAVTAKLIRAFVFATSIVQFLFFLYPKFQASTLLLCLHRPVYVRPGRKYQRPVFSCHGSYHNMCSCLLKVGASPVWSHKTNCNHMKIIQVVYQLDFYLFIYRTCKKLI